MINPVKVLIACDSFKDALSADQVCLAISEGLREKYSDIEFIILPLSDGGEGFLGTLNNPDFTVKEIICKDSMMGETKARYLIDNIHRNAYIESAEACGIQKIDKHNRNPLYTTTYGVGELIANAMNEGVEKIYVGLGGSSTHDLGIGMAEGLGFEFYNSNSLIKYAKGCDLGDIDKIVSENAKTKNLQIVGVSDVKNKLSGENGAARTFAKQKGASEQEVELLEEYTKRFIERFDDKNYSLNNGSGAAGGLGFGIQFFLGGKIIDGIDFMLDQLQFDDKIKDVDFIITGEGKLDAQTLEGKVIKGICSRKKHTQVIAICGKVELDTNLILEKLGIKQAYEIYKPEYSLEENLKRTFENLRDKAKEITFIK